MDNSNVLCLVFKSEKVQLDVKKYVQQFSKEDRLVIERLWIGSLHKEKIESNFCIDHGIEWVDDTIGYGVFSTSNIKEGAYIGQYAGVVKPYRILRYRRNDYIGEYSIGGKYPLKFIVDAEKQGNFTRFINHSDEPNLKSIVVILSGLMHIIFLSTKEIKKGEQLTFDYGPNYWKHRNKI